MSNIHFILQGKGGIGKSLISTILAEYFISKGQTPHCIDCDPINQTFSDFKALNAYHLQILKDGVIDPRAFDELIEKFSTVSEGKDDNPFIVDNGSSGFLPFSDYLLSQEIIPLLKEMGHEVYIHTLLAGGDNIKDTMEGFVGIATHFDSVPLVVWHNKYFGSLSVNGKAIEDEPIYVEHNKNIFAQIVLCKPSEPTFGKDLIDLRRKKLTLSEGIGHLKFGLMTRHRLKVLRDGYFSALEQSRL